MHRKSSTQRATEAASGTPEQLSLVGTGMLVVSPDHRVRISFAMRAVDGCPPGLLHVYAVPEFLAPLVGRKSVRLDVFGVEFRSNVAGYVKDTPALLIAAAPFFRAMARAAVSQQ